MTRREGSRLQRDERGVSAVLGVALLLAITVILAVVVGVFVFDVDERLSGSDVTVNTDFRYNQSSDRLEIVHGGGVVLTDENTGGLRITGDFDSNVSTWDTETFTDPTAEETAIKDGESVEATERMWVGEGFDSSDEIVITWVSADGEQSKVIGEYTVP